MIETSYNLTGVVVTQVYTLVKTHGNVHLKWVYALYVNCTFIKLILKVKKGSIHK